MSKRAADSNVCHTVAAVLITRQLGCRPARPRDYLRENAALLLLAEKMTHDPRAVLQKIAELTLELCHADSAGVSLFDGERPGQSLRWQVVSGPLAPHEGLTFPFGASPCGTAVTRNAVLLFREADRFFTSLKTVEPRIYEHLIVPWEVNRKVTGTLWAAAHRPEQCFDAADARLLTDLSHFASAAYAVLGWTSAAEELRAQRTAALNLMEDAVQSRSALELENSERRKAQASLRHSEERLRLIVENARDFAIFATDMERRVTSWNSGAERILGYGEAEIVGQSADIIFTPEDRAAGACEREAQTALAEGRANDERWHIRKDGIRFWGSGVMTAMHGPAGEALGFVKVLRDQTEAKRAQEALSQSQAELEAALRAAEAARQEAEAANRTKDLFLATLSHELRTPLTPIAFAVDGLLRRADLPTRFKEALEMISRNVQIEATLVADLLDVTRISRGILELACSRLDVHEAVRQAVEVVEAEIQAKQQQLAVDLAAERSELEGDFIRLQQAFWNLLKNSSKFTPACGQVRVSSRNEDLDWLVIEIVDTGRGVDPAALPHIFEAFRQEERAVTTQFGGLGLGLAITRAIIVGHNGSIAAFSAGRNQGFTCTIKLPLASPRNLS